MLLTPIYFERYPASTDFSKVVGLSLFCNSKSDFDSCNPEKVRTQKTNCYITNVLVFICQTLGCGAVLEA